MKKNYEQIFFYLDSKLEDSTFFIGEFPLCGVLLMNNMRYPWIILVPKCENASELTDISPEQRAQFIEEVAKAEEAMRSAYWPDKMNIASMGNHVEQLHMHVIARFKTDDIWPRPVWGTQTAPYNEKSKEETIAVLRKEFNKLNEFHTIANN